MARISRHVQALQSGGCRRAPSCTSARSPAASRAAVGVAAGGVVEGQPELVGERRQPCERVAELVQLLRLVALSRRTRQLADLLGQPRDGGGHATRRVAFPVGPRHQLLEGAELHRGDPTVAPMADEREYRQAPFAPPAGALDLLLVRHGASMPWVPGHDFLLADGHGDPALAPDGVEQAHKVAARLATERIDAIYVSSLRRTHETAAPLARLTGIEPRLEPDLREVYLGDWEGGVFRQKVADADPLAVRMFELERWDVIPGAERSEAFAARVRAAVMRLASAHPDQRVVAFTHGGVIGSVLQQAARSRGFAFANPDNASISQVVIVGDRWIVRRFNDTAHLTPAFSVAGAPPL